MDQLNQDRFDSVRKENAQLKGLVEWARTLLCSATPNQKFLDEKMQHEWAQAFGKWFAQSHDINNKDAHNERFEEMRDCLHAIINLDEKGLSPSNELIERAKRAIGFNQLEK